MKLPTGIKSSKPPLPGVTNHVTVRMNQVMKTGPSNKPVSSQVNDSRTKTEMTASRETKWGTNRSP